MPPPKTALLVVDMQSFFRSMTTSNLPNILSLLKAFSSQSSALPIIFTQHGHSESELREKPPRNQLVRKWGVEESIREGSSGWEIMRELRDYLPQATKETKRSARAEADDDEQISFPVVIPKNTYDAFLPPSPPHYSPTPSNRQLLHVLNEGRIERVVVCGVMTDCCVDATARGCFNRGFETWVVSDACGSANKAQHERALKCHEFGFGEILRTEAVLGRLKKEGILK